MKKIVIYYLLICVLFIGSGCKLPLKKEMLMTAKDMELTENEKAFIAFRQVFTEKARGHHLSLIESTKSLWPVHYQNDEALKSLIVLVGGKQREAASSEVRELLQEDDEWLGKAFVFLLRENAPDSDYDQESDQWQNNLDETLACFADINIDSDRSLDDLNSDALACFALMSNDAHRQAFACYAGFLLDDAYTRGIIDPTLIHN